MTDYQDGTYELIGLAMKVHTSLGPGLREKPYENALAVALRKEGIQFEQQRGYPIEYEGVIVGECVPDLVVGEIVVDVKSVDKMGDSEMAQVLNYLRITGKRIGLVVNFKNPKLEWKRVVL